MLSGFSLPHLIVLLVIVLLIFGTKKLRTLGGDLGSTIKEFKKALSDDDSKNNSPTTPPNITNNDDSQNDQSKSS